MATNRRAIVLFTNSEHGQSNVILATAYELLLKGDYDIHIVSYEVLADRVSNLNRIVRKQHSGEPKDATQATFHAIHSPSMKQIWDRSGRELPHPAGVWAALKAYQTLPFVLFGWTPAEYMSQYAECLRILEELKPVAAVSDPLLFQARDAIEITGTPFVMLNATTLDHMVRSLQPNGAILWRYPTTGSGIEFPIPWYKIPSNILTIFGSASVLLRSHQLQNLNKAREEAGFSHKLGLFKWWDKDWLQLCGSLPEIEYPMDIIPENVVGCGPILLPSDPVEEVDADLSAWLNGRPTVLINLGTHFISDPGFISSASEALETFLENHPDTQILWKVKFAEEHTANVREALGQYLKEDRIRMTDWLEADPIALFKTGNVLFSVNHGGGNSFNEGLWAGIPQVLLPAWFDCYEFAARIEWLGCGIWANRGYAPGISAKQLAAAMERAIGDEKLRARAHEVGQICQKAGGRVLASQKISDFAKSKLSSE